MNNDFNLEKLEISKRMGHLETKFACLEANQENMKCKIDEIHRALMGSNGSCGIIKSVDRLEQTVKGWKDSVKVAWAAIIGIAVKTFWGVFGR